MGRVSALEIGPGDVLAGRYRVESELGRGGMGVVLAVRHVALGTRMALKVMRPDVAAEPESARRFLREARAAARIESDHVVRVFDVGTLDSGQPYMAMEHLEGMDLGRLLAERGRLPLSEAVVFLLQALDALGEAHSLGIVHRDLKPSNLFIVHRRDGSSELKVLDFGAAKIVKRSTAGDLTGSTHSQLVGTPQYMSPEQLRAKPDLDARTDIWSLGVILFQLVSGILPFEGDTFPELCASIIAGPPADLHGPSPELGAVLQRCLAKAREARYASVHELEDALLPMAPEAVRVAQASKTVRRPATQALAPAVSETELEMPSTVLQSNESSPSSLVATATAHVPRSGSPRSKRALFVLLGLGSMAIAAGLFQRTNSASRVADRAVISAAAAVQATVTPPVPAEPAAPAGAIATEVAHPETRPSREPMRRLNPAPRPRSSASSAPSANVAAAAAAAPAPVGSSFSRSAMGGRL